MSDAFRSLFPAKKPRAPLLRLAFERDLPGNDDPEPRLRLTCARRVDGLLEIGCGPPSEVSVGEHGDVGWARSFFGECDPDDSLDVPRDIELEKLRAIVVTGRLWAHHVHTPDCNEWDSGFAVEEILSTTPRDEAAEKIEAQRVEWRRLALDEIEQKLRDADVRVQRWGDAILKVSTEAGGFVTLSLALNAVSCNRHYEPVVEGPLSTGWRVRELVRSAGSHAWKDLVAFCPRCPDEKGRSA